MARQLIDLVPKPLLDELVRNRWLPVVGAGFSRNASVRFGPAPVAWGELGLALAEELHDVDLDMGTLEAISAYEHAFGRATLVERVATLVRAHDAEPAHAHAAFAKIAFDTVLTTNFDFLLESAYRAAGRPCLPLVGESQLSSRFSEVGTRLIKFHGDVHHPDALVITEGDYDHFLLSNPMLATTVSALFVDNTPVLIGYSLDDPDTRQMLALVRSRLGPNSRQLWTIQVGASIASIARFERRGVKVINLPKPPKGASIDEHLATLFDQLAEHVLIEIAKLSSSSEGEIQADLQLPPGASRSCLFLVPFELLGWYREHVYPTVQQLGLVPLSAHDVASPGDTLVQKIDALIDRAAVVIVDLGSDATQVELGLANAKAKPVVEIAPSVTHGSLLGLPNRQVLIRPVDLDDNVDTFVSSLRDELRDRGVIPMRKEKSDAIVLLEMGKAGPALILAMTELEVELRRLLESIDASQRRSGTRDLITMAAREGTISPQEQEMLFIASRQRNEAVHNNADPPIADVRKLINNVLGIVERLRRE